MVHIKLDSNTVDALFPTQSDSHSQMEIPTWCIDLFAKLNYRLSSTIIAYIAGDEQQSPPWHGERTQAQAIIGVRRYIGNLCS